MKERRSSLARCPNACASLLGASALGLIAVLLLPAVVLGARPGQLDRSFGDEGSAKARFESHSVANSVTIDGPGRIVAAGTSGFQFALARFRSDGELETSFGEGGMLTTGFAGGGGHVESWARSVALGAASRIPRATS